MGEGVEKMAGDLTPRQQETLDFILSYTGQAGYPPTLREIAAGMEIRGLHAVRKHLDALVVKGHLVRKKGARRLSSGVLFPRSVPVPILGRVVAGNPQFSEEEHQGTWSIDPAWMPDGPAFFLRVRGDSMKNAAILDGDYVLVHARTVASAGEIVVAAVDGETTVKRLKRRGEDFFLVPENPDFSDIPIPDPELFRIAGVVVGVFRFSGGEDA